jgi:hypothetical protein
MEVWNRRLWMFSEHSHNAVLLDTVILQFSPRALPRTNGHLVSLYFSSAIASIFGVKKCRG